MRKIRHLHTAEISACVARLCVLANTRLPGRMDDLLRAARDRESYELAKDALSLICRNAEMALHQQMPICQDTGMAVVYAEVGQDVHLTGGTLDEAIHEGIVRGYREGYLRMSVVSDPFRRTNTGDNTPAIIHTRLVAGDRIKLTIAPKGFGSENMSRLAMLNPSDGIRGAADFVLETVRLAGANPCPPMVLGVGIGGTFERAAQLAKEALVEQREGPHPDPFYEELEDTLLRRINELGIGPQGFGGRTTALAVWIKAFPTHIAGLPVAVNMGCHANRHASETL
ncbi:MAG: fumarate hydratase [Clostridia bacterium]|nr:fumarate hydratase [Clostridia bacterium]